jgi:hypothetical protein
MFEDCAVCNGPVLPSARLPREQVPRRARTRDQLPRGGGRVSVHRLRGARAEQPAELVREAGASVLCYAILYYAILCCAVLCTNAAVCRLPSACAADQRGPEHGPLRVGEAGGPERGQQAGRAAGAVCGVRCPPRVTLAVVLASCIHVTYVSRHVVSCLCVCVCVSVSVSVSNPVSVCVSNSLSLSVCMCVCAQAAAADPVLATLAERPIKTWGPAEVCVCHCQGAAARRRRCCCRVATYASYATTPTTPTLLLHRKIDY